MPERSNDYSPGDLCRRHQRFPCPECGTSHCAGCTCPFCVPRAPGPDPKLRIRVVCQNGHEAWSYFRRQGLDMHWEAPWSDSCNCPKFALGEGWRPAGPLEVVPSEQEGSA